MCTKEITSLAAMQLEPVLPMPHIGGLPPDPSPVPQPLQGQEPSNSLPALGESQTVLALMMMVSLESSFCPRVIAVDVTAARTVGTRKIERGAVQATDQAAQAPAAATMPLPPATPSQRNGATCLAVGRYSPHQVANNPWRDFFCLPAMWSYLSLATARYWPAGCCVSG